MELKNKANFYCQKIVGDAEFSIEEWDKQRKLCEELKIPMPDELPACEKQCSACLSIVRETQSKTKKLILKYNLPRNND